MCVTWRRSSRLNMALNPLPATCVTRLIHMRDMTHLYVWLDVLSRVLIWFTCVTWLKDSCLLNMALNPLPATCVTWLKDSCLFYMALNLLPATYVTWLIHMRDMTLCHMCSHDSHVWHGSFVWLNTARNPWRTWFIHMRSTCVTRPIRVCVCVCVCVHVYRRTLRDTCKKHCETLLKISCVCVQGGKNP